MDLEPAEQRPTLRVAPAAASMIWLGSIALATAIYMEWLPARALFRDQHEPNSELERTARKRTSEPAGPTASAIEPAPTNVHRAAIPTSPPARASDDGAALPPSNTISTPSVVPESSRTIRGSYYSDDSNWAGGW